jgi:PAS domain-containing protein
MLVLDLRWVLFGILILGFAITGLIAWLLSHFDLAQRTLLPFPAEAQAILARAPFGLVLLDGPGAYRYANPYAQRLLGLRALSGALPHSHWTEALGQDCVAAQDGSMVAALYHCAHGQFSRWQHPAKIGCHFSRRGRGMGQGAGHCALM